jgi:PhnB protein
MALKKKKVRAKVAAKKAKKVEAVPARYGTATAMLVVSPCKEALQFYEKAFGAKVLGVMEGFGSLVVHAEMKIGDSIVMLNDEMPPMPPMPGGQAATPHKSPKNAGSHSGGVMLYVPNVDSAFKKAVDAGATIIMPVSDMFWGDRYAQVEDPFGHMWSMGTHIKDVSAKESQKAMAKMMPGPQGS